MALIKQIPSYEVMNLIIEFKALDFKALVQNTNKSNISLILWLNKANS
jgi:hypothetical protein